MADIPPARDGLATTVPIAAGLHEVDRLQRAPFFLTFAEVKLLGIAGVCSLYVYSFVYH
jgi:PHS family inorganic phosphate transporter-like MFS transporter